MWKENEWNRTHANVQPRTDCIVRGRFLVSPCICMRPCEHVPIAYTHCISPRPPTAGVVVIAWQGHWPCAFCVQQRIWRKVQGDDARWKVYVMFMYESQHQCGSHECNGTVTVCIHHFELQWLWFYTRHTELLINVLLRWRLFSFSGFHLYHLHTQIVYVQFCIVTRNSFVSCAPRRFPQPTESQQEPSRTLLLLARVACLLEPHLRQATTDVPKQELFLAARVSWSGLLELQTHVAVHCFSLACHPAPHLNGTVMERANSGRGQINRMKCGGGWVFR